MYAPPGSAPGGTPPSSPQGPLDHCAQLVDDDFLALNTKTVAEVRLERDRLAYLIAGHRPPMARDLPVAKPPALRL